MTIKLGKERHKDKLYCAQGCLRALFGEQFCTESRFKMGFCQWPEMGSKVGFLGAKVERQWAKTHLCTHFGPISGH